MDGKDVMTEMAKNVERAFESLLIEEVRYDDGEAATAARGAVGLERVFRVGFSLRSHFGEELKYFENASFTALGREFTLNTVAERNQIDPVKIREADIAESCSDSPRIVELERLPIIHGLTGI